MFVSVAHNHLLQKSRVIKMKPQINTDAHR